MYECVCNIGLCACLYIPIYVRCINKYTHIHRFDIDTYK